jgi:hypothetical protein
VEGSLELQVLLEQVDKKDSPLHRGEVAVPRIQVKGVLPGQNSLAQVDNLVVRARNPSPVAHLRQGRNREPREGENRREVLILLKGYDRASRINLHTAQGGQTASRVPQRLEARQRQEPPKKVVQAKNHLAASSYPRLHLVRHKEISKTPLQERRGNPPQKDRELLKRLKKRLRRQASPPLGNRGRKARVENHPIRQEVKKINPRGLQ